MGDLTLECFKILAKHFKTKNEPTLFQLGRKSNIQDDPFDTYVFNVLKNGLEKKGIKCIPPRGPLISPDLVLINPRMFSRKWSEDTKCLTDLNTIVAIEIKKVERTSDGKIARATGIDFNTTPPCGTVRIYVQTYDRKD